MITSMQASNSGSQAKSGRAAQPQGTGENVHANARQRDLCPGEKAVGAAQGQNVEEQAEGIESGMLTGGQERHTGEDVGVP
jgi:hypothetical protein